MNNNFKFGFYNDHSYCILNNANTLNKEEKNKILQPDLNDELKPKTIDVSSKLFLNENNNEKV